MCYRTKPSLRNIISHRCGKLFPVPFIYAFAFTSFNIFGSISTFAQSPDGIGLPQILFNQPQAYNFRQVGNSLSTIPSIHLPGPSINFYNNRTSTNDSHTGNQLQQYERDLQAVTIRDQQANGYQKDLQQEKFYKDYLEHLNATRIYRSTFSQLISTFNPDSFSIIKAIYLVENAYYNNTLPYDKFVNAISAKATLVKQILKRERIDTKNNTALNYGIQKLFSQANYFYNTKTKQTITIQPIQYDFKDFKGEKDLSQVFVTKLLTSGKGQCHSMPLLYLCVAEILGAKANLSLAPEHSFIQVFDNNNRRLSFECTNGNLVSEGWLMQSGFINATALKNKTYLDTLSQRKLFAQCLADLAIGYQKRFGNDDFLKEMQQKIEQIDSSNLAAKILSANMATVFALNQIKSAGSPRPEELANYPVAYQAYLQMQESYTRLDNTGFQEMPPEIYQAWLKSIEKEQENQRTRELQKQVKQEIDLLKKLKPTFKFEKRN